MKAQQTSFLVHNLIHTYVVICNFTQSLKTFLCESVIEESVDDSVTLSFSGQHFVVDFLLHITGKDTQHFNAAKHFLVFFTKNQNTCRQAGDPARTHFPRHGEIYTSSKPITISRLYNIHKKSSRMFGTFRNINTFVLRKHYVGLDKRVWICNLLCVQKRTGKGASCPPACSREWSISLLPARACLDFTGPCCSMRRY